MKYLCNPGVGAPRNSLQSEELSLSCITREGEEEEEEDFNIPVSYSVRKLFYNFPGFIFFPKILVL